ncbi:hypothetical protein AAMO2058_000628000 [Amorphochlora amoebiformis]
MDCRKSPQLLKLLESKDSAVLTGGIILENGWACIARGRNGLALWNAGSPDSPLLLADFHEAKLIETNPDVRRIQMYTGRDGTPYFFLYVTSSGSVVMGNLRRKNVRLGRIKLVILVHLPLLTHETATTLILLDQNHCLMGTSTGRMFVVALRNRSKIILKELRKSWSIYESANWMLNRGIFSQPIVNVTCVSSSEGVCQLVACSKARVSNWNLELKTLEAQHLGDATYPDFEKEIKSMLGDKEVMEQAQSVDVLGLEVLNEDLVVLIRASSTRFLSYFLVLVELALTGSQIRSIKQIRQVDRASQLHSQDKARIHVIGMGNKIVTVVAMNSWVGVYIEDGDGFQKTVSLDSPQDDILADGLLRSQSAPPHLLLLKTNPNSTISIDCTTQKAIHASLSLSGPLRPSVSVPTPSSGKRGGPEGGGTGLEDSRGLDVVSGTSIPENKKTQYDRLLEVIRGWENNFFDQNQRVNLAKLMDPASSQEDLNHAVVNVSKEIINGLPGGGKEPEAARTLSYEGAVIVNALVSKMKLYERFCMVLEHSSKGQTLFDKLEPGIQLIVKENFEVLGTSLKFKIYLNDLDKKAANRDRRLLFKAMQAAVKTPNRYEKNQLRFPGLTVPEIFFSHVSFLHGFFGELESLRIESLSDVKILFDVVHNLLKSSSFFKSKFRKSKLNLKDPKYKSWTYTSCGIILKILKSCQKFLGDYPEIGSPSGNRGEGTSFTEGSNDDLYQTAYQLGSLLLSNMEDHIRRAPNFVQYSVDFIEARKIVVAILNPKQLQELVNLAEQFEDFEYLVKYCHEIKDPKKRDRQLMRYAKRFSSIHAKPPILQDSNFVKTVVEFYSRTDFPMRRLLEVSTLQGFEGVGELVSQMQTESKWKFGMHHGWLDAVGKGDVKRGRQALIEVGEKEENLWESKTLWSISKLTALTTPTLPNIEDKHLTLINANEVLSAHVSASAGRMRESSRKVTRERETILQLLRACGEKKLSGRHGTQTPEERQALATAALRVFDRFYFQSRDPGGSKLFAEMWAIVVDNSGSEIRSLRKMREQNQLLDEQKEVRETLKDSAVGSFLGAVGCLKEKIKYYEQIGNIINLSSDDLHQKLILNKFVQVCATTSLPASEGGSTSENRWVDLGDQNTDPSSLAPAEISNAFTSFSAGSPIFSAGSPILGDASNAPGKRRGSVTASRRTILRASRRKSAAMS